MLHSNIRVVCIAIFMVLFQVPVCDFACADIISFDESFSGIGGTFDESGWSVAGQGQFATNSANDHVYVLQSAGSTDSDGIFRTVGSGSFHSEFRVANPIEFGGPSAFGIRILDNDSGPGGADEVRMFLTEFGTAQGSLRAIFSSTRIGGSVYTAGDLHLGSAVSSVAFHLDYEMDIQGTGVFLASIDVNDSGNFQSLGTIDAANYGVSAAVNRKLIMELSAFGSVPRIELDHARLNSVPEPATGFLSLFLCLALTARRTRRRCRSECGEANFQLI